jgi:hypothetical protein
LLQEFRRRYGLEKGLLPEHPRAGSTDDVEGIFAFLHGLLGPIFDEKDFHDAFPKVISEYTKKCDPDLPFYYYNDGLIQSFNVPSSSGEERLDHVCISRRADPGSVVSNRATIPQRGQLSVRTAYFKPAESLPPPPAPPGEKILRMALHACIICIPNSMVLSAILEKHAQGQEFSKSERRRKYHECMFFQIA